MANRVKTLTVSAKDRVELERRVRSQTGEAREARRARIVLMAAEGRPAAEIAELVGCSVNTVASWRAAYAGGAWPGWRIDRARDARAPVDAEKQREVLWHTLLRPPEDLGVTHWSSRLLAKRVGLHFTQVAQIWRHWNILPARRTHDYVRHGTTTLFAALEVATGKVTDACYPRHRHQDFLKFLKQVAAAYRGYRCTSSATTTAPTSTPRCSNGWRATNASACTSLPRRRAGSTS